MASGREIKSKIKSVNNTRKMTRALEMVSASKIRKAQERIKTMRPYVESMKHLMAHLAQANMQDASDPFLCPRADIKRVGYIVVSSDRGLAGGLNSSLFRRLLGQIREWQNKGVGVDLVTIGQKASAFFRRIDLSIIGSATYLGDSPELEECIGVVKVMLDAYREKKIDQIALVYNRFVNTMVQKATIDRLFPLPEREEKLASYSWDYLYEPDSSSILHHVVTRYIESLVYQAIVENIASEHAARMVAMKAASDNANKLIQQLQLVYNKARQAAITQEISEIVGGAAAV